MFRDPYYNNLFSWLPELLLAILVLVFGYLIAKVVENGLYKKLRKSRVNERLNIKDVKWSAEKIISKVVFVGILLLAFILFFNLMDMNLIATPFVSMYSGISGAVLGILKAALILLFAWILALVIKKIILMAGRKLNLSKIVAKTGIPPEEVNKSKWVETAANIAFYLILLLFVPAVLHALGLSGVSGPFEGMLTGFMNFIPKLVGAALIFFVGLLVAKIVRNILTKLLESIGTDRFSQKFKLTSFVKGTSVSGLIGTVAFILIMIPVTISALEVLDLEGISQPAIVMLNDIMTMLPKIAVAIVLVLVGIVLARWVKSVVETLLENLGINSLFGKMGLRTVVAPMPSIAGIIGTIVQVVVVLLFTVEALQILNLHFMVTLATGIFAYLPMVVVAIVILAVGFWLANLAEKIVGSVMTTKGGAPHVLRYVAKYAILAFALFMALSQLGIAPAIINTAFILILGGVALAFGLAFGLGGREHAARYLSKMENSLHDAEVSKEKWKQQKTEYKKDVNRARERTESAIDETVAGNGISASNAPDGFTDPLVEKPFSGSPYEEGGFNVDMTKSDGKYPNKEDLEPNIKGMPNSDELPLADPSDSNTSEVFRENEREETGENKPSAFGSNKTNNTNPGLNKPVSDERYPSNEDNKENNNFDQHTHDKWNEEKPNENPFKP